jgi:hypothetical protein
VVIANVFRDIVIINEFGRRMVIELYSICYIV